MSKRLHPRDWQFYSHRLFLHATEQTVSIIPVTKVFVALSQIKEDILANLDPN